MGPAGRRRGTGQVHDDATIDRIYLLINYIASDRPTLLIRLDKTADMKIFDWTAKYSDDRGIIRAAMMARKKKMARYLSEEAFRRGTMDNVTVVVVWLK